MATQAPQSTPGAQKPPEAQKSQWWTNLTGRVTGRGSAPANPDAELDYVEDRHLLLLEQKRWRLRAWVSAELARVEAGDDRPTIAAPERRGRLHRGK